MMRRKNLSKVCDLYQQSFLTYLKSMTSPSLVKMTASQILPIPGTSGAPLSSSTTTALGGGFSSVTSCRPARLAACLALACLRALAWALLALESRELAALDLELPALDLALFLLDEAAS